MLPLVMLQLLLMELIFNDTASNDAAVAVLDFGGDKTSTAGTFTIQFPTADASNLLFVLHR